MSPTATTPADSREGFCYQRTPDETPSEAVISAVSAVTNRNVIPRTTDDDGADSLEPLYDAINPDALNALFSASGSGSNCSGRVVFTYSGHEVTVESTGEVWVSELPVSKEF